MRNGTSAAGERARTAERGAAEILAFVAPGLVHGMGNHLFSIHAHAQMLHGSAAEIARDKTILVKAAEKALHALSILRFLSGEQGTDAGVQAGVLLHRLCELLRVPLREHGLGIRFDHVSTETPAHVDGTALCRALVEVLRHLAAAAPACVEATVEVTLVSQRSDHVLVTVRVRSDPSQLPFPFDLAAIVPAVRAGLEACGAGLESDAQQLRVRIPVVGEGEGAR